MRIVVENWIYHGHETTFFYPQSWSDAVKVYAARQLSNSYSENMTPPPVALNTIQWDPLIIQALGCDPTTIDTSQALEADTVFLGDDCETEGSDSEHVLDI